MEIVELIADLATIGSFLIALVLAIKQSRRK